MAIKILPFLRLLTVEPITFLTVFIFAFKNLPLNLLLQDKVCMQKYNLSLGYCQELPTLKAVDDTLGMKATILSEVSKFTLNVSILITVPVLVITLLIGPFIDKHKPAKKTLLIVAAVNGLIEHSVLVVNSYFFSIHYNFLYVPSLISALCGGVLVAFTAIWAYVAAVTPPHLRSLRMTVSELFLFAGPLLGTPLSGNLLPLGSPFSGEPRNTTSLFLFCCAASIVILLISLFLVDEDKDIALFQLHFPSEESQAKNTVIPVSEKTEERKVSPKKKHPLWILFDLQNVKDMFRTFSKPRRHHIRLHIVLLVVSYNALLLGYLGPAIFLFPYVQQVFNWNSAMYSNYSTVASLINVISTALLMPLLVKVFKLSDLTFSLISFTCFLAQNLLRVSSKALWSFYAGLPFHVLNSMGMVGQRAYLTRIVEPAELGQIFALMSALDGILPLIASLIFTPLFTMTIDTQPNLSFLPTCICLGIGILCMLVVYAQSKATLAKVESERKQVSDNEVKSPTIESMT